MSDAPANTEMAAYWNGPESSIWVEDQAHYERQLEPFVEPLLDAAAIRAGARVLDVGCGCGATSRAAAGRGAEVVGVDISAPMIARARETAATEGIDRASFAVGDAQTDALGEGFDAVISRFGVMFFDDPVAAFANIRRAMAPGGRLAFTCWQTLFANEWVTVPMTAAFTVVAPPEMTVSGATPAPGPWSLAEPDRVRSVLQSAGFTDVALDAVSPRVRTGADARDATSHMLASGMARAVFGEIDQETHARIAAAMIDALGPYETDAGVVLDSAAWLVAARSAG
jgi:SAM-dependent methyltransferase